MNENIRKKAKLDTDEIKYSTKKGELVLIPKYKLDKKFPKAGILKWQERNMDNSINELRKRLTLS